MLPIDDVDLQHIWTYAKSCLPELDSARLFLTGGTGFFGCWLLESLRCAQQTFGLKTEIVVLTRNPEMFVQHQPHLAKMPRINFLLGDVTNFVYPDGEFTHVIHAATQASAHLNQDHPFSMQDTIVKGTRHVLD